MKLATWNINSVRLRINLVRDYLKDADIDFVCRQETNSPTLFSWIDVASI